MKYKLLVLNKHMNVVYTAKLSIHSLNELKDLFRVHSDAFWRIKYKDPDASLRLIPDVDKTLDLFTQNNNDLIF